MATEAVWYDIFRRITLKVTDDGGIVTTAGTIEADAYKDTLTITAGKGVAFNPNEAGDAYDIDVNYQLYVPIGTSTLRLQDVNNNTRDVKLTPGFGVYINRSASDELVFSSYGVAENDTLHSITTRGAITTNKLIISDLEVGDIISQPGVDGFSSLGIEFNGDGTLDNPATLQGVYTGVTDATYTKTYEFSVGAAGILSYAASYRPPYNLSTGSIVLEREDPLNPGSWSVIAQQTGTISNTTYQIANTYSETYTGAVNYRITVNWTGNTGQAQVNVKLYYEVYDIATNILFQTDTATDEVYFNGRIGIDTFDPAVSLDINRVDAIRIPVGTTAERPATGADGYIRFNTTTGKYEGYQNGNWAVLGSVTDLDLNTTITAELTPGANDDTLRFYNANYLSASLTSSLLDLNNDVQVRINNATQSTDTLTGALVVDGGVAVKKNLNVAGNVGVTNNLTVPSIFTSLIDSTDSSAITVTPATIFSSDVVVENNLSVTSTSIFNDAVDINSTLTVQGLTQFNDNVGVTGTFETDSDATFNANVTIGDANTDTITFNSRVSSNFTPELTATHALGEDALRWSDLFVSDTVNVADYTLPLADGTVSQVIKTDGAGNLSFGSADTFGGNRVYVSAAKGNDANDGITAPVASIKRAAQIASELAYSPVTLDNDIEAETAALRAAKQSIADDTITYINTTYPTLVYDSAKCARDVQEIIDSAIYDLRFGGNSRSVAAGEYYYDGTGSLYITGQETETVAAINYAKGLAVTYLTGARATAIGDSFDIVTSIITNIANAPAKTYGTYKSTQITIMVASGEYVEQNPIILGDNISIVGDNLRRSVVRPANANLDMFCVRNSSYINNITFRDGLAAGVPDYTFRYAISFDNVTNTATSRAGYTNLPVKRPKIFTSPYIQNCSVISFLGAGGVEIDGNLIDTPNTPPNNIEAENPVNVIDGIPEQGKSMVANAFTILSFGGVAWRVINDAYAQIVSCFVIFTENGCISQNGGYLSITNSASNFGLFALRASGYSPNAFEFDRGYISGNGIYESLQSLKLVGLKRAPLEHFVIRIRNTSNIDITDTFNNNSTFGITESITASPTSVGGNTITFASAHSFNTGDIIEYDSNGNIEIVGLLNEMTYYVSVTSATQIQLFHDEGLTKPVRNMDASPTGGTHNFNLGYEEFYIDEVVSSHNQYQVLTIPAGSYTINPGDTIQATDGSKVISAVIHSYDSGTNQLTVSVELVQEGSVLVRNYFSTNATIDAGEIAAGTVSISAVSNRDDLYSSEVAIRSTKNRQMQSIGNTALNQVYLHRPSVVNSSAHTWEYAGSGTDYNALPQNGGQTDEFFEQVSTLPGRVYSSGTNELGDFKVGDFVRAFNRTGNIEFKNKVEIGELDSLALSLSSGIVVDEISLDINLGDSEVGGPSNSRLVTQLAARSFIENKLGNFIDQNLSTNAVPNAVVQLNGQGRLNADLIPPTSGTSAFKLTAWNDRLTLHDQAPPIDLKPGDIAVEEYQEIVLTLTGSISVTSGDVIFQAMTDGTGTIKETTTGSTIKIVDFSGTFVTGEELFLDDSTPLGANSVPTVVSSPVDKSDNYFLAVANDKQFLILDPAGSYTFTTTIANATPVVSATNGATATASEHRVGVISTLDVLNLSGGTGYLTPGTYTDVALTGGTGSGALAEIVVSGGVVDSIDLTFGGSGYTDGDTLSASSADIGGLGGGGTAFSVDVLEIENRLYVDLDPSVGILFNATETNIDFIADDNASTIVLNQTGQSVTSFNAADTGSGGDVDYTAEQITVTGHSFVDGDPVVYNSGANPSIGGLTSTSTYYVKVVDANTIELYQDYALNTQITFSTSSSGTHDLTIDYVNLTANTIYSASHGLTTGDAVQYTATTPVTGIQSGDFLFVGSVTTNSFTLHTARGNALSSVNGLTVSPVNLSADGAGNANIVVQNVQVVGEINSSGSSIDNWGSLTTSTIDASGIISGVIETSRLATGSANNLTFLRGDSTWATAVSGLTATAPVTLAGNSNTGTYYGDVDIRVELASYDNPLAPSAGTETTGIAAFDFDHFEIDGNGKVTTKTSANGGVIDAASLSGQLGSYYLNPVNLSRAVPIENGGTNRFNYTQGDLLYAATNLGTGGYSESLSSLAIGSANSILQSNGTTPEWTDTLTLADLTVGNIQVAVTGDNEIDTSSGNLTIDSAGGTVTVDDNLVVNGTSTLNGDIDLGNANTDTVTFVAKVDSTILPSADDTHDLGATGEAWKDLYLKESVVFEGATGENTISVPTNLADALSITDGTTDFFIATSTTGAVTAKIDTNLEVTGNLTVNGTTTTVNSTTVTVDDPVFTLGGDTAPTTDDNKDRGIEFRWHDGTNAKVGFFGFDDSTGKFTFIPDATNTSEVFSGTQGTIQVSAVEASNVQVGVSAANEIDTSSGNLVLDSASGTTLIDDNTVSFADQVLQLSDGLDSVDTNQKVLASFATTRSGGKFVISFTQGTARHITELLVTHDGTTAIASEYGTVFTGTSLFTLDVDISGGNVRVLATPETATSGTFRISGQILF